MSQKTANPIKSYRDVEDVMHSLADLDAEEMELVQALIEYAKAHAEYTAFSNWWMPRVDKFYSGRGLTRSQIGKSLPFTIAQDLAARISLEEGWTRLPDYRDELEELINSQYHTRREFCAASGMSEDMLSHVLAKRKHVGIDTLAEALFRIGYRLKIAPLAEANGK